MDGNKKRRIVFVNGEWVPETEAKVSVFDRGFLMGDAVYEVVAVARRRLIDFTGHVARLERSLGELSMEMPCSARDLLDLHRKAVEKNDVDHGLVYLQVTRGAASDRDFIYPEQSTTPQTVVIFTQTKPPIDPNPKRGNRIISIPDYRWGRRDIKTTQLLYQSMGKMMAKAAQCDDAWMVDPYTNLVTEGTSNNAFIIMGSKIVTRHLGTEVLHGITRAAVLRYAKQYDMVVEERAFSVSEAQQADEAFTTSASTFLVPVVEIDGVRLGGGQPGPVTRRLRHIYIEESIKHAV